MKRNFILIASVLMCASAAASWAQQTPVTEANYDMAERFSPNKVNRMVFSQTVNPSWFPNSDKRSRLLDCGPCCQEQKGGL